MGRFRDAEEPGGTLAGGGRRRGGGVFGGFGRCTWVSDLVDELAKLLRLALFLPLWPPPRCRPSSTLRHPLPSQGGLGP